MKTKKQKKAQTAIELIIVVGFIIFFFAAFLFVINENIEQKNRERENFLARETALTIQDEINLAHKSVDGYMRNFTLPAKVAGKDYNVIVQANMVYFNTSNFGISLPIQNITGQIKKGTNTITKKSGIVYLNSF